MNMTNGAPDYGAPRFILAKYLWLCVYVMFDADNNRIDNAVRRNSIKKINPTVFLTKAVGFECKKLCYS